MQVWLLLHAIVSPETSNNTCELLQQWLWLGFCPPNLAQELAANSNWQHNGKGILGNVVHSSQVDTLQNHHSLLFVTLALKLYLFSNTNNNELMPNRMHLFFIQWKHDHPFPGRQYKILTFVCGKCSFFF